MACDTAPTWYDPYSRTGLRSHRVYLPAKNVREWYSQGHGVFQQLASSELAANHRHSVPSASTVISSTTVDARTPADCGVTCFNSVLPGTLAVPGPMNGDIGMHVVLDFGTLLSKGGPWSASRAS
ncbi:hypothetical protein N7450_006939 [Penicillium hetheringtonii]|uniref:Uncharacterized protein n=1 Tax=Penicillium hetheringtonii TaxID=911720 RepID=A0AAD6DGF8_9EURO|nr:hypothetical protein N7450_006939 [Penicillium hetheringtonii]